MAERVRIEEIEVDKITVGRRERVVTEEALAVLDASFEDQDGFTTPVHVRKVKGGFELIDGAHRMEVAKRRGLQTILARIWTCSKAQARFLEVDANVSTADLTPVALARSLAVRHEAYVKLHPETAAGTAGAMAKHGLQTTELSFADFVAEARGISTRHIQRIIQAGRSLNQWEVGVLETAPRRISLDDLCELAKVSATDERDYVIKSLASGETKKASAARKAWAESQGNAPAPQNPDDKAFTALCQAWARAPKKVRTRFLETYAAQIEEEAPSLFDQIGGAGD